jgi:hypothetical protein
VELKNATQVAFAFTAPEIKLTVQTDSFVRKPVGAESERWKLLLEARDLTVKFE